MNEQVVKLELSYFIVLLCTFVMTLSASVYANNGHQETVYNKEAVIPPQCYTKTESRFNPCYVCHQSYPENAKRNKQNDGELQGVYAFSDLGTTNQWHNLFASKAAKVKLTDAEIQEYIAVDNYEALRKSSDNQADVYNPDLKALAYPERAFGKDGFANDGSGWVAFSYKPFPSTFWPTNGSFDDVMIRLPEAFRRSRDGNVNKAIYQVNLALAEMAIKSLTKISIANIDEGMLGIDINGDNVLSQAQSVVWRANYIGQAESQQLFQERLPIGTEFLHSVRYLQVGDDGQLQGSVRMKELRYMRKYKDLNDKALAFTYNQEAREKDQGQLPVYAWREPLGEAGMNNKMGWNLKAWIEDEKGQLRKQSYEETFACMGCHTSVGSTIDNTFSFARKVTGKKGWTYINLKGMPDAPNVGEDSGEFLNYFKRVGGGDEFRQNEEMQQRWFVGGQPKATLITNTDVYTLITPSLERAHELNRAYLSLVKSQSFIHGRDVVLGAGKNIHRSVDPDKIAPLPENKHFQYDIRLQWPNEE